MTVVKREELDRIAFSLLNGDLSRLIGILEKVKEHHNDGHFSFQVEFDGENATMILYGDRIGIGEDRENDA